MISEVMKEIARGCIDERVSAGVVFGTVISADPLRVRVEDKLILDEELLAVPEHLKKRTVEMNCCDGEIRTVEIWRGIQAGDRAAVLRLGDCWLLAGMLG